MVVVSVPMHWREVDEAEAMWAHLRATQTTDIHKLCLDDELSLVAQVPVSLLSAEVLERLIREAVAIADTPDEDLTSPDALRRSAASGAMEALFARGTGEQMLGRMVRDLSSHGEAAQALPNLCHAVGISCVPEEKEGNYRLTLDPGSLKVLALCRGPRASFLAWVGELRPRRGHLAFYRRMAEINAKMDICRVALDRDDDVTFLYELPALNEAALRDMAERLPTYMLIHGLQLMILAGGRGRHVAVVPLRAADVRATAHAGLRSSGRCRRLSGG